MRISTGIRLGVSIAFLALAGWIFFNRQLVIDQFTVWRYEPQVGISRLAGRARMSDTGRFYFYASQPTLNDKKEFSKHCTSKEENSVVLGCYARQRIYIYNVADERLDGIKEVTAAHEMLHAVYERLSRDEKHRVDSLIESEMKTITNSRLKARLKVYERTEPGERLNELHSILGAEVKNLGKELEAYYAKYFDEREKLVALFSKYESVFAKLEAEQDQLYDSLIGLSRTLKTRTEAYNASVEALNQDIAQFNARAGEVGGFSSQAEFTVARNQLIASQGRLEAERTSINNAVDAYNQKRKKLQALNLRAKDLQSSLDSTPAPVPDL